MALYKVTDAWAVDDGTAITAVSLDFEGTDDGGATVDVDGAQFALIATLMALGCPVYYSTDRSISTEPSFANQTYSNFPAGRARLVLSTDVFWSFASKKGVLSMVLDNRSRVKLDMNDPGRLAAWSLTASTHDVLFDGTTLRSRVETGIP